MQEKMLDETKRILRDKYEIAKYDSGDVSEIFELYEKVVENLNQKLYVKLDSDKNICYAIIDKKGRVKAERKNRDYRFFLDNIYVLGYRNFEL